MKTSIEEQLEFEEQDFFKLDPNAPFAQELIRYVNHLKDQIVFERKMNRYKNLVIAALLAQNDGSPEKDITEWNHEIKQTNTGKGPWHMDQRWHH